MDANGKSFYFHQISYYVTAQTNIYKNKHWNKFLSVQTEAIKLYFEIP